MGAVEWTESEIESRVLDVGVIDPDVIAAEIAKRHGISVETLRGRSRRSRVMKARHQLYRALRTVDMSFPDIAKYVGQRHHTTVLQALAPRSQKKEKYKKQKSRAARPFVKAHWLGRAGVYVDGLLNLDGAAAKAAQELYLHELLEEGSDACPDGGGP